MRWRRRRRRWGVRRWQRWWWRGRHGRRGWRRRHARHCEVVHTHLAQLEAALASWQLQSHVSASSRAHSRLHARRVPPVEGAVGLCALVRATLVRSAALFSAHPKLIRIEPQPRLVGDVVHHHVLEAVRRAQIQLEPWVDGAAASRLARLAVDDSVNAVCSGVRTATATFGAHSRRRQWKASERLHRRHRWRGRGGRRRRRRQAWRRGK
mmetsp:Transcript_28233/g.65993  ORF Transcript_28233/g.65993 Transcript_28233/m.65993 type:complete len:209 (+) Transcript_28233:2055-2681(+)